MENRIIKDYASNIKDYSGLLSLINMIQSEEISDNKTSFDELQLCSYARLGKKKFRKYNIKKKSGGQRTISIPNITGYKRFLHYIKLILQSLYNAPRCVNGFVLGKSIVDNALAHQGHTYIYNIDLENFFHSVSYRQVEKSLQQNPFNCSKKFSHAIANFCCMNSVLEGVNSIHKYCLPQGSPASPILTNIVCYRMDKQLVELSRLHNVRYTRYADDMTFSSDCDIFSYKSDFIKQLQHIIFKNGFKINYKKTRHSHSGERQKVTGIILSQEKINVGRLYVRQLRNLFYIWESYGANEAEKSLKRLYTKEGKEHKREIHLKDVVLGKLLYLKMVKGEDDIIYQKFSKKYNYLINNDIKKQNNIPNKIKRSIEVKADNHEKKSLTTASPFSEKVAPNEYEIQLPVYLFFDTETTGLPEDYNAPSSNINNWPRLVQLSWILTDASYDIISQQDHIIYPEGFVIPEDASRIHGITTFIAKERGERINIVLQEFMNDFRKATCIVGHNISYDKKIVGAELIRLGIRDSMNDIRTIDTMKSSVNFCKISGKYGYKWPKLQELHKALFSYEFENAHNSMSDVEATLKCFVELKHRKIL